MTRPSLPYVLMRGGTSKGVFLRGSDLPPPGPERDAVILDLFGSPDPRQIDGIGGADLLTSKLAIIDPPSRSDADLDYTFAQVSVTDPVVDYDINCGNVSAAVGAFAVDEGFVTANGPTVSVRIHNTNTGKILVADVPIEDGVAAIEGDASIDGVPGTGAPIHLDYRGTAGGATGALLPTGNRLDLLSVAGRQIEATVVDIANLSVFFAADVVGMSGTEGPGDLTDSQLDAIADIKAAAAALVGISGDGLTPVPVAVAEPSSFTSFATGQRVDASSFDLLARVIGGRPPVLHKAYPGTVGATTGVAASINGTIVDRVTSGRSGDSLRIGHPSGTMTVQARVESTHEIPVVERAAYTRTARRIAEGRAYLKRDPTNT